MEKDIYKSSRFNYILEAGFEYFISILVTGAFLAKVSVSIGINDALTGILTALASLCCSFQLVAIFLANKRPVKRWVTILHTLNQIFFALVYLTPVIKLSKLAKIVAFVIFLLLGNIINQIVNAPKINWFMELVDDHKRGSFTATKEIVSLIGGMTFTFIMGWVVDYYEAQGNLNVAFIVCGITVFTLMVLHSLTLILSKEKPAENHQSESTKKIIKDLIRDKNLFRVVIVFVLYSIVECVAIPFYGTYQIKELGFTMTYVSVLAAAYAIVRALVSKPLGRFADKHSFAKMLNICYLISLSGLIINIFTVPANGKIFYTAYYVLYAISMGGISSANINLVYDNVDKEKRMSAMALCRAASGLIGFFATLLVSPLVAYIQGNGNKFLGLNVYAQQVVSVISAIILIGLIFYLNLVVRKKNKKV